MSEALTRIQDALRMLSEALEKINRIEGLTDEQIENIVNPDNPNAGKVPDENPITIGTSAAAAAEAGKKLDESLKKVDESVEYWTDYIDKQQARVMAMVFEAPKVTSPEHKVVQRMVTVKPPPELPEPFSTWLLDISYILYNYIVAGLLHEIEIKPADLDRYIDDFIKICEIAIRVKLGAAASS